MLVITRRIGESLIIGDVIDVTVLGVKGSQVRLGISAPQSIPVHREEIYLKIKAEQEQSASLQKANNPNASEQPQPIN